MEQVLPWISEALSVSALGAAAGGPNLFAQLAPLILIFVIFYFLLIRPQQKRARELQEMQNALKRGDQVITNGGLMGKVVRVREDYLELELAQGVTVKILKGAIQSLQGRGAPTAANDRKKGKPKQISHEDAQIEEEGDLNQLDADKPKAIGESRPGTQDKDKDKE